MIFYILAFKEDELYQMFQNFYLMYFPNYLVGQTELMAFFESMSEKLDIKAKKD